MSSVSVPEKVREVGKVVTPLTIANRGDQARAAAGDIPPDQVRTVTLGAVIVDTGATTLALPADVIARLGLTVRREGTFDCLELPAGMDALLGVIPIEALGLEPDLHNQRLRLLPEEPGDTYYTVY